MKRRLWAAVALIGAGCTTTTVSSLDDERARWWLTDHVASEMRVETDRGPEPASVVVEATPAGLQFRATPAPVVPIENLRRLTVVKHGRGTLEGAGLGVGIGAALGALYGLTRGLSAYESSMDCTIVCNNDDAAAWGAFGFGVMGLLSGVITGAIVGHRDVLELR